MTSIPQELVDMIIDEVGDNKESLQACALASRAFYPRASAHLFERIRLRAFEKRFDAFRDLCHQNPRLAQLVKSLHIIHRREDANLWLSEIIRNVSALTLEQVVLAGCTQLPSFNKLTMLRLIDVKLPRVPQAHELFKNIPRLERLILESISLPEKEDFAPSESPPPVSEHYLDDRDCIHLRELVLRPDHTLLQGSSAFVYRSRAYGVSFSQLEKLTFEGVYNAYGYRALEEIVDTAAESLVSLDMSFAYELFGVKPGLSPTNFIHLPHVRHIAFVLKDYSRLSFRPVSVLEWWLGNLEQLPHPSPIETITISLMVDSRCSQIRASCSHPIWKALDTFLQGPCAPHFRWLRFSIQAHYVCNQTALSVVKELLLDYFPLLRKSKKLVVTIKLKEPSHGYF
ncbi:hypothetical protein DFS33DRAFT_166470 [Desarmillaria ectypa]|nr:hypothetical protein DFS33DRAFT_166470 [Desarmillaria ectypa]